MPEREYSAGSGYRYGFNGMERDDDSKGIGNSYTTEFRQYDPRIGRWFSIDPKSRELPEHSPYISMGNNPITQTDIGGDFFTNVIGFAVGATVDYAFQVGANILNNGGRVSVDAFTNVDKTSILISGAAGFLTSGASSSSIIAKGITKEGLKQVAKIEAKNLTINTSEAIAKQINAKMKDPEIPNPSLMQ